MIQGQNRRELLLGIDTQAGGRKVFLGERDRATHMQIVGSTGTGKSKMLEWMIRQDILHRQGLCLIDPHASLYHHLTRWLEWNRLERQVILFDPGEEGWVVSFNPLAKRGLDLAFQMDSMVRACAKVWGDADLSQTPLLQRNLRNVFYVLAEQGLTLVEALHLISDSDASLRRSLTGNIGDEVIREQWRLYNALSPREFRETFASTQNRLVEFLSSPRMRRIFGQSRNTIDFRRLMDEGAILLVNLSWGSSVSPQNARMLGTLLINDLFNAARNRPEGARPYYLYIDECSEFANEDTAQILDQCRKWGLHLILAHQHLSQLERVSKSLLQSVLTNAKSKLVFGGLTPEDAEILARQIFLGEFDLNEEKLRLLSRKVTDYREETRTVQSWSRGTSSSWSESSGLSTMEGWSSTQGGGETHSATPYPSDPTVTTSTSWSQALSAGSGSSAMSGRGETESESYGESTVPFLVPVWGEETAGVQFRSLEEQLHRAMALLVNQPTRHGLLKLPNQKVMAVQAPLVQPGHANEARVARYRERCCAVAAFIKPREAAEDEIAQRQAELVRQSQQDWVLPEPEPIIGSPVAPAKRKGSPPPKLPR